MHVVRQDGVSMIFTLQRITTIVRALYLKYVHLRFITFTFFRKDFDTIHFMFVP